MRSRIFHLTLLVVGIVHSIMDPSTNPIGMLHFLQSTASNRTRIRLFRHQGCSSRPKTKLWLGRNSIVYLGYFSIPTSHHTQVEMSSKATTQPTRSWLKAPLQFKWKKTPACRLQPTTSVTPCRIPPPALAPNSPYLRGERYLVHSSYRLVKFETKRPSERGWLQSAGWAYLLVRDAGLVVCYCYCCMMLVVRLSFTLGLQVG